MSELSALIKKNFIIWKQNRVSLYAELTCAVLFGMVLYIFRSNSTTASYPNFSYLNSSLGLYPAQLTPASYPDTPFPENYNYWYGNNSLLFNMTKGASNMLFKDCLPEITNPQKRNGGYIALAPENGFTAQMAQVFTQFNFSVKFFANQEAIQDFIKADGYGDPDPAAPSKPNSICLGVSFQSMTPGNWSYSVHYNETGNPGWYDLMALDQPEVIPFQVQTPLDYHWVNQINSGFAVIQSLVTNLIIRQETANPNANLDSSITIVPVNAYNYIPLFANTNKGDLSFEIIFPIMINFLKLLYNIVNEKEKRITENMRNMGMSLYNNYFSWVIFNTCSLLLTTLIWSIIAKATFFIYTNFFLIWLLILLPGLFFQSAAIFISAMFTKAKSAIISGIIFLFICDVVRTAKGAIQNPTESMLKYFALSPSEAMSSAGSIMTLIESSETGMGWQDINSSINNFKYVYFLQMQSIGIVFFLVLGIYLDQVWPSEIGMRRHPLFFLGFPFKAKEGENKRDSMVSLIEEDSGDNDSFEEVEETLKAQTKEDKTLKIRGLRKVYSNGKVAVDNLSLEMYSGQIFALLGHNGAGKTTTISMISGLLTQTKGMIKILGNDTIADAEQNRKVLGICPQTNPIYENLSCYEHLVLYSTIKNKGGGPAYSESEIDELLQSLDLFEKKHYPASKLSGGQKRKLCVAIAFIGGSKVILLDEPTSGMDTYARRYLWEMLRNFKKDRIIILSTHYMDEADYLGDRIGIMGKGKLITCGSSMFLKKRYGIGYDLTVVKKSAEVPTVPITEAVKKFIETAIKSGDISMEVKYQLPASESPNFEQLFLFLENNQDTLGIQTFGISLTTLEEVFLKVAIEQEKDKKTDGYLEIEDQNVRVAKTDEKFELNDIRIKNQSQIFWMHFRALCQKRWTYFKRDKRGLICELILPVVIIFLGMSMTKIQFIKEGKPGPLSLDIVQPTQTIWTGSADGGPTAAFNTYLPTVLSASPGLKWNSLAVGNVGYFDYQLANNMIPNRFFSPFVEKYDPVGLQYQYNCFVNTTAPMSINTCLSMMDNVIYKDIRSDPAATISINIAPMALTKQIAAFENTATGFISAILVSIAFAFIPASLIVIIVKERENNVKHQQIVSGVSITAYWLSNLLVDFLKYLVPGGLTVAILFAYDVSILINGSGLSATLCLFLLYGPALILFTYLCSFGFKSPAKAQFAMFLLNYLCGSILTMISFVLRLLKSTKNIQINFIEYILRFLPIYDLSFGLFSMCNGVIWQITYNLPEKPGVWSKYAALPSVVYLICISILYFSIILFIEWKRQSLAKLFSKMTQNKLSYEGEDEDVTREREEVKSSDDYAVKVEDLMIQYVVGGGGGCCKKSKVQATKMAVRGVSFGVKKGECFGLLGTNGAGKTSTFKVLSGEVVPNYGKGLIAGLNVETDMKTIGSLIGYCPQFDALLDNLTAREHLELYASIKGIPYNLREQLIKNKLQQLNLEQYEHVLAGTYSGGNKRKLSVAIALLGNPPIILLDEPSSGMDPEARRFMWSVVSQISTQNKTSSVILTTHSMEEAEALSSKLAIMVEGRIQCIGAVQHLKSKYGKGYEIEVKIQVPKEEEILALKAQVESVARAESKLDQATIVAVFNRLGLVGFEGQFAPEGKCALFHNQLGKNIAISLNAVLEFVFINLRAEAIIAFLRKHFAGEVALIESVNTFYRYKLEKNVKLSDLFGQLEPAYARLGISQYSVKQTTIEQIFINFADQREVKDE